MKYTTIQSLIGQPVAVHCPTEAEANEFLKMCHKEGVKWSGGYGAATNNLWNTNKATTYYTLHTGKIMFGDLKLCSHITIPFSEFTNKPQPYTPEHLEFMDRCAIAAMQAEIQSYPNGISEKHVDETAKISYLMSVAMLKAKQLLTNK